MSPPRLAEPVLVTGATGFIGSHLVLRLLQEGYTVRVLALPDDPLPRLWGGRIDLRRGDVADAAAVEQAMAGVATVFHLAAVVQDWGRSALHERVTVGGTRHVLGRAAAEDARAVLVSSIVVYGDQIGRVDCHEDLPPGRPLGPYSRSKLAQEEIGREFAESVGLRLTVVRPSNVFGPGSRPWVHEVVHLLQRRGITLIDGGEQSAGLCWIDNLVEILLRAGSVEGAVGRVYNAADGGDVSWRRYFTDLAKMVGAPPPRSASLRLARPLATLFEMVWRTLPFARRRPPITHEALNLVGSSHRIPIDRACEELGFEPVVSYEQAMEVLAGYVEMRC